MPRGSGKEAEVGAVVTGSGSTARHVALAFGLLAALAAPVSASAAPEETGVNLRVATAPASELEQVGAISLPGGATAYRFQQRVSGVKVLNGQVVVSDPQGAPPELVADSSKPGIEAPPSPRVGKAAAIAAAARSVGVGRPRGQASASLAIAKGEGSPRRPSDAPRGGGTLVWRVIILAARPLGDFEVLVDADSGRVVRTRDLLQYRRGHAQLYNPNPVVENGGSQGLRRDHGDRNTRRLTSLRRPVTLRNIRRGQRCLRGRWVHAKLGRSPREVCKRGLNWRGVKRSKDRFEALMTYFHIDRAQRYIQRLGFGTGRAKGIRKHSQLAVADAFSDDNSYYSLGSRRIEFGTGGIDDAEDADVILHEYGHAIQDAQVRWFGYGNQAGAIGEGFGDYLAAVMSSRSPGTGNADDVCIFDWDGTALGSYVPAFHRRCGRRADNDDTVPEAQGVCPIDAYVWCVGEVWSSALWDLRDVIGGKAFDRILLSSQFMYTTNEHFDGAVEALVAADQALTQGANRDLICAEMEIQRGISVADCP